MTNEYRATEADIQAARLRSMEDRDGSYEDQRKAFNERMIREGMEIAERRGFGSHPGGEVVVKDGQTTYRAHKDYGHFSVFQLQDGQRLSINGLETNVGQLRGLVAQGVVSMADAKSALEAQARVIGDRDFKATDDMLRAAPGKR